MQKRIYVAVAAGIMILGGLHNAKADDVYVENIFNGHSMVVEGF